MAATATAASACAGASRNCELLIGLHELHAQRCAQAGITGPDAVVNAAAVGLVIEVWRNGPVEDMHAVLLDRTRSWAGTGGKTLKYPGYGFLGEYDRHVKDRVSALMTLDDHTCVSVPLDLYLVSRALVYGRNHKGMPGWREIVDRIGALLADPTHPGLAGPRSRRARTRHDAAAVVLTRPAHRYPTGGTVYPAGGGAGMAE